jgi:hypothetical protein
MSSWGDILTEQLRGDIFIEQQHLIGIALTSPAATAHYRAGRDDVVRTHNVTAHL